MSSAPKKPPLSSGGDVTALFPFTRRDRAKPGKNAKPNRRAANSLPDEKIKEIMHYALDNPEEEHRSVGRRFGVDGGRISEFLGSLRTERMIRLRDEVAQERGGKWW